MVVLASRLARVRRRWRGALRRFSVQEAADARRLETLLASRTPSVVIVDVGLLVTRGVTEITALQRLSPASRFIVVSDEPGEREGVAAFRAGARGYCHRDLDPALLPKAVEVVQKGEIWAGRALVAHLIEALGTRPQTAGPHQNGTRLSGLTQRERQIADRVADGASNKEIAVRLGVTERTVKAHLTAIFRKLGLSDRLRLALYLTATGEGPSRHGRGSARDAGGKPGDARA